MSLQHLKSRRLTKRQRKASGQRNNAFMTWHRFGRDIELKDGTEYRGYQGGTWVLK